MSQPIDARTIALEFCSNVWDKPTKSQIAKTVIQAKQILDEGYVVDDVLLVMNYIWKETTVSMYSLGYVKATIKDLLPKAIAHRDSAIAKEEQEKLIKQLRDKEEQNDSERNRNKAKHYGILTGKRKKHTFDMLNE